MGKATANILKEYCERCNKKVLFYDIIHVSNGNAGKNNEKVCLECWNKDIAKTMKLDFEHIKLNPVTLRDIEGKPHLFHFQIRLLPVGLFIDAIEIKQGEPMGYHFSIRGECDANQSDLILDLYTKIKKGLARKYIKKSNRIGNSIKDAIVCGRIMWDEESDGRVPKLIIDGEEVTWEEFGRILMSYEGFQFKFQIFDLIVDIN